LSCYHSQNIWVLDGSSHMDPSNGFSANYLPVSVAGLSRAFDTPEVLDVQEGLLNRNWQSATIHVGMRFNLSGNINGVIYLVTPAQFTAIDLDELSGEVGNLRQAIPFVSFTVLFNATTANGVAPGPTDQFYAYMLNDTYRVTGPNRNLLIPQSYIDKCLSGAANIDTQFKTGTQFTDMWMSTTMNWNVAYWVNDRVLPRKPSAYTPLVTSVDSALFRALGSSIYSIQLDAVPNSTVDAFIQTTNFNINYLQAAVVNITLGNNNAAIIAQLISSLNASNTRIQILEDKMVVVKEEATFLLTVVIAFLVVFGVVMIAVLIYLWTTKNKFSEWVDEQMAKTPLKDTMLRPTASYGTYEQQ